MTPRKQIKYWKKKLRILKSWRIYFDPKSEYKGQVHLNNKKKTCTIYDLRGWKDEKGMPSDYIFHELLHTAMREMRSKRSHREKVNAEEILVRDICMIVDEANGFNRRNKK